VSLEILPGRRICHFRSVLPAPGEPWVLAECDPMKHHRAFLAHRVECLPATDVRWQFGHRSRGLMPAARLAGYDRQLALNHGPTLARSAHVLRQSLALGIAFFRKEPFTLQRFRHCVVAERMSVLFGR